MLGQIRRKEKEEEQGEQYTCSVFKAVESHKRDITVEIGSYPIKVFHSIQAVL